MATEKPSLADALRASLMAAQPSHGTDAPPAAGYKRYQVIIRGGLIVPRAAITLYAPDEDAAERRVTAWAKLMDPTAYVDEVAELA